MPEGEPRQTLGDLLRTYRLRQGLTQEELAARVEPQLSVDTISKLERGVTRPYAHTLDGLRRALALDESEWAALHAARRAMRVASRTAARSADTLPPLELLPERRPAARLTQGTLAEQAGIGTGTIQDLEHGRSQPHRDTVLRLADALGPPPVRRIAVTRAATPSVRRRAQAVPRSPTGGLADPVEGWQRGQLPRVWNVPHPRNPNFTGRDALLAGLAAALASGRPAALTQAITGLGGVGKTQLAAEYVYRHATDYAVVWWVRCEESATLAAEYAVLAHALGLPERGESRQALVVAAVQGWLRRHSDWLLVFDNASDPSQLRAYLAHGGRGHMLITSRHAAWRSVAHSMSVRVLGREEAVAFLLERTGQTDELCARGVAEALGDLPLALEQAGAYMEATGRTLAEYLRLFEAHQADLLRREPRPADYPATVLTTWEMAFRQVSEVAPAAADLLHVCAFLAPDHIERPVMSQHAKYLPQPLQDAVCDPLAFDDAVQAVLCYSLMEVTEAGLSMHRLVQAVARDRLERMNMRGSDAQRGWAEVAVRLVNAAFPQVEVRNWSTCAALLPHAMASCAHAQALGVAPAITSRLLNRVGSYLGERAQFPEAIAALEQALATCRESLGAEHPETATTLHTLGLVVRAQGDLAAAGGFLAQAAAISERTLGAEHRETATRMLDLGQLLRAQGDLAGARPYLEHAVAVRERVLGAHDPSTANALSHLGGLLHAQGDLVGARPYLERAVAICETVIGGADRETANSFTNLGLLLEAQGDLSGARGCLERALAIRTAALGPDHRDTASSLNYLGNVLHRQGDLLGARSKLERALAICERVLGPDHPHTATSLNNLGRLLQSQGNLVEAYALLERALTIRQTALGQQHPDTARSMSSLGRVLRDQRDLAGARSHFERALAIREAVLGPDHLELASSLEDLASVLPEQGELNAARAYLERVIAIRQAALGADHPETATSLDHLRNLLQARPRQSSKRRRS